MPELVKSADGTTIAYDVAGGGPPLVITGGAFNTRVSPQALVPLLAPHFTVVTWDRRGRGDSADTPPYAVEREVEDLAAVIAATGGGAFDYGHSSGAILLLEAAIRGVDVKAIAVYEAPYVPGNLAAMAGVQPALDAGDPSLAALTFMKGANPETPDSVTEAPWWPAMAAIAHTLPYDLALTGDGIVPTGRLEVIRVPALVVSGGASPAWAGEAADAIASALPHATRRTIQGEQHNVDPALLAPELIDLFTQRKISRTR